MWRERKVKQKKVGNGDECPSLVEEMPCNIAPCLGCIPSEWSEWSDCRASCGKGTQFRTRYIVQKAEPGSPGPFCPADKKHPFYRQVRSCDAKNYDGSVRRCTVLTFHKVAGGNFKEPVCVRDSEYTRVCCKDGTMSEDRYMHFYATEFCHDRGGLCDAADLTGQTDKAAWANESCNPVGISGYGVGGDLLTLKMSKLKEKVARDESLLAQLDDEIATYLAAQGDEPLPPTGSPPDCGGDDDDDNSSAHGVTVVLAGLAGVGGALIVALVAGLVVTMHKGRGGRSSKDASQPDDTAARSATFPLNPDPEHHPTSPSNNPDSQYVNATQAERQPSFQVQMDKADKVDKVDTRGGAGRGGMGHSPPANALRPTSTVNGGRSHSSPVQEHLRQESSTLSTRETTRATTRI